MANLARQPQQHPCPRCRIHCEKIPVHFCEVKNCKCSDCKPLSSNRKIFMQNGLMWCIRCRYHGIGSPLKHICPNQECTCSECQEIAFENGKRVLRCTLCRHHVSNSSPNEHPNGVCPYKNCTCVKCNVSNERQTLWKRELLDSAVEARENTARQNNRPQQPVEEPANLAGTLNQMQYMQMVYLEYRRQNL